MRITGVDVFCGAGGLTAGLRAAEIEIRAGIDLDSDCAHPFAANNDAVFVNADIGDLDLDQVRSFLVGGDATLLAGCAPCQPFSTYTQGSKQATYKDRWALLSDFADLIIALRPDVVTMENVWRLAHHQVFETFVERLKIKGYTVTYSIFDCRLHGIPQSRKRLVLFASLHGLVSAPEPTTETANSWRTVRQTIEDLPALQAGEVHQDDPVHAASGLSDINLRRIRASRPGGTWGDWPEKLVAACHRKKTGRSYPGVYGRMEWDKPAPTITGQCFGFGNGRFGHPQQDRAISLREAAMLQTFPRNYSFLRPGEPVFFTRVGQMIGNAVPPLLGEAIGRAIRNHFETTHQIEDSPRVGSPDTARMAG